MRKAERVKLFGRDLICPFCEHDAFFRASVMLVPDNPFRQTGATGYVCERCGRIEWFKSGKPSD